MICAIEVVGSTGVTKIFTPTGVEGEWEMELQTVRGPEPGGYWRSEEVARAVVDDIYEGAS
jgi:hypothetical protein